MAREGPLLSSVRRLIREVEEEEILALPVPPLPVRLWAAEEGGVLRVDLLIDLGDEADTQGAIGRLAESGARIGTWTGRTATASAPVSELGRLLDNDLNVFIDAAATVRPSLDVSVPEAWSAGLGSAVGRWTGEGVVIGVVDSGIDVTHESFRTATGSTRVLALCNQVLPGPWREWDSTTIDRCLSSATLPHEMMDPTGHGTAVAGVAAGNGLAAPCGRYLGLAPSADLVVAAIQAPRQAYGSTANLVDAARFIFEYAEARGQRAVVNISQGVQIGAHDPAGALERAFTDLLSQDERRVLVLSAGNTGDADAHARFGIAEGQQLDIAFDVPVGVGPIVLIDIWYDRHDEVELSVLAPDGSETDPVKGTESRPLPVGQGICEFTGVPNELSVRASNVHVKLLTSRYRGDVIDGRWVLRVTGTSMTSGADVHAWLDRGWSASPRFAGHVVDSDVTLTSPATARGVLAVGSYQVSPHLGPLASSSARGPARRGENVNLLAAPGESVTTCAAAPRAGAAHTRMRGTSLAAAHVTGALALLLQANPGLTRVQAIDCILANARADEHTAAGPESGWGFGKLDVAAALSCAEAIHRKPMSRTEMKMSQPIDEAPDAEGRAVTVEISSEPGLAEILEAEEPIGDERLTPALDDFLGPSGVADTALAGSLIEHTRRQSDLTEEAFGGAWEGLKRWWKGQKQQVAGEEQMRVTLEAYWLTLPDVSGAEVTVTSSRSKGKEASASLTIAGIGGGPKFNLSVKEDVELPSKTPGRFLLSAIGTFQKIVVTDASGNVVQTYARLVKLDEDNLIWTWRPDPLPDKATWGQQKSSTTFELTGQPETAKRKLEINHGTTWEFGGELNLAQLGLKASLGGTLTYDSEVTYSYSLPGDHDYVATSYKAFPAFVWRVTT